MEYLILKPGDIIVLYRVETHIKNLTPGSRINGFLKDGVPFVSIFNVAIALCYHFVQELTT